MNTLIRTLCISLLSIQPLVAQKTTMTVEATMNVTNASVYIQGDLVMSGAEANVKQDGSMSLTGNFYNNVTAENVFDKSSSGLFRFIGNTPQLITGNADRAINYIDFFNVDIKNSETVSLASSMGATVQNLDLQQGRFILKSDVLSDTETRNAHLLVNKGVKYNRVESDKYAPDDDKDDRGVVEVELALGNARDSLFFGFSSPYQRMYGDYTFYNFLIRPDNSGLFGNTNNTIIDPYYVMKPGEGYLVGQNVYDEGHIHSKFVGPEWMETDYEERFKNLLRLNRHQFEIEAKTLSQFVKSDNKESDPQYAMEMLNLSNVPVKMEEAGFYYVGNPFTAPLDMSSFLDNSSADWGPSRGETDDLAPAFWVVSRGNSTFANNETETFRLSVSYLVAQGAGSTTTAELDPLGGNLIPPMGMFLVYANRKPSGDFIIPANKRVHGDARFLKNAQSANELLIQAEDQDTKGYDRLSLVFRKDGSLKSNDRYDASKYFNRSGGVTQVFTKSSDGLDLTANVLPLGLDSLTMFLIPAAVKKTVKLSAYRLSSLDNSVREIWLQDTQKNGMDQWTALKTADPNWLNQTKTTYEYQSSPNDPTNRFIIWFREPKDAMGIDDGTMNDLNTVYANGTLSISGIEGTDIGSQIYIFDMGGHKIYANRIDQEGTMEEQVALHPGVYIVRIQGNRILNKKILAN